MVKCNPMFKGVVDRNTLSQNQICVNTLFSVCPVWPHHLLEVRDGFFLNRRELDAHQYPTADYIAGHPVQYMTESSIVIHDYSTQHPWSKMDITCLGHREFTIKKKKERRGEVKTGMSKGQPFKYRCLCFLFTWIFFGVYVINNCVGVCGATVWGDCALIFTNCFDGPP